ncbi:ArsR/SmtB family transcription factor [Paenibacillus donghaensis]|uniref:Transcriptional regulator n=1 Tax=Paenibacillus donghaensis TaxID=414771 RepID=A0A2Z2KAY8_9BACL|nr:winged helix-turn-helix domain-containing protein [Paenibacillus donghaensis]ASA22824.1 transcriptional regulator [Paenibacillus donghaensis]
MTYEVEIQFQPIYELVNSLHTFICKRSYKKMDLGPGWAAETAKGLSEELLSRLEQTELDQNWKLMNLLIYCCPCKETVESVLVWIAGLSIGELYETLSGFITVFPSHMEEFRSEMLFLLTEWNRQYFSKCDPELLSALRKHADEKQQLAVSSLDPAAFIDATTNGFYFEPIEGLQQVVLIPQFHFQPANIIYCYGSLTLCHYSARISSAQEDIPPFMHRTLRSLGEKSRLKILQSLSGERRTFTEIVKQAGISKGIVHDHIFSLRSAGMLYAYIEGENVTSYSLRLQGIQQMNDQLYAYLQ